MSRNEALYQMSTWIEIVSKNMSQLSKPQAKLLAMYSFGMVLTSRSGRTSVAAVLAELLNEEEANIDSRLRDWYCEAAAKPGYDAERQVGRDQVDVGTCFEPWLRWILSHWQDRVLPLALDATMLRDRFIVLSISLVYRGNAIPIAWKILPGNQSHPWEPEWERLLTLLQPAVPPSMLVLVLTDRGLYSRSLFRKIQEFHWHPFMRIKNGGSFRPQEQNFLPLATFAARRGQFWCGVGTAFQRVSRQQPATLLAFWAQEAKEPWLILTDLPPDQAEICWYALRFWIEPSFRTIKRGGLLWHHTKMTDPERAERLWLPMALAMFWFMSAGTPRDELQITTPAFSTDLPTTEALPPNLPATGLPMRQTLTQRQPLPTRPVRKLSVTRRGWFHTLVSLVSGHAVQFSDLIFGPLPSITGIFAPY